MRKPRDWGQPCPNPDCSLYNRMHKGNVSAISTYKACVVGIQVFFSDGFTCYLAALIAAFHVVMTFARSGK